MSDIARARFYLEKAKQFTEGSPRWRIDQAESILDRLEARLAEIAELASELGDCVVLPDGRIGRRIAEIKRLAEGRAEEEANEQV